MQPTALFAFALATLAVTPAYATFWFSPVQTTPVTKAVVVLQGPGTAKGYVYFEQKSPYSPVTVTGNVTGLDHDSQRGFHVHQAGDLSGGCATAGPHFNPLKKSHGAPTDAERHVGDLGNIKSDGTGLAMISFTDKLISLNGPLSIIGRAIVLHAGVDDLGRGGTPDSLTTGNAGARAACGVIAIVA